MLRKSVPSEQGGPGMRMLAVKDTHRPQAPWGWAPSRRRRGPVSPLQAQVGCRVTETHTQPETSPKFDFFFPHSNPVMLAMDREAWLAAVHGVAESWTRLNSNPEDKGTSYLGHLFGGSVALLLLPAPRPTPRLCPQLPPALTRRRPARRLAFVRRPPGSPLLSTAAPGEGWSGRRA